MQSMKSLDQLIKHLPEIEASLGYTFKQKNLILLAFTHRSFTNESRTTHDHNERLEFLGDSVLGLLISDYLYLTLCSTPEGDLSYLRSRLVEAKSCVTYFQKLNLEKYILLGKGEQVNAGRGRDTVLADLFEAIIGAIYLDGGLEEAKDFLFKNFSPEIEAILETPVQNWKALLQDFCQKKYQHTPTYEVLDEAGPDHSKIFKVAVIVNREQAGLGEGASKKEAQQSAAKDALHKLERLN